jgi:hypothetical protein
VALSFGTTARSQLRQFRSVIPAGCDLELIEDSARLPFRAEQSDLWGGQVSLDCGEVSLLKRFMLKTRISLLYGELLLPLESER